MHRNIFLIIAVIAVILIVSCKLFEKEEPKPIEIYGCMDSTATNYNPDATIDDGSCDYCREGSSFLLISTDGGETWEFNCPQDMDIGLAFQISVVDLENIWIACRQSENENYYEALLYSSDKGRTWEVKRTIPYQVYQEGGAGLDQIKFVDENNGLIVVDEPNVGPVFYSTIDGGNNWTQVQTPPTEGSLRNHERVDFIDLQTVYFLNTNIAPRILYGTTDLGAPWDTTHFSNVFMLEFYDKNIGLAADHSNIYRTIDSGITWHTFHQSVFNDSFWGQGIRFSNKTAKDVWLLDNRNIFFSSDTGRTWNNYPYNDDVADDMYLYNNEAWILGSTKIRYSSDATKGNWTEILLPSQPYPIKIYPEVIGGYKDEIIVMTGSF